jgi:hypothetical protein
LYFASDSDRNFFTALTNIGDLNMPDDPLEVEIVPVTQQAPMTPKCTAVLLQTAARWDESSLDITWDSQRRAFKVFFVGKQEAAAEERLIQEIPIEIACSSYCVCGSKLRLGSYGVQAANGEFTFKGEFICESCQRPIQATSSGFRSILLKCLRQLKRIQINVNNGTAAVSIEKA